MKKRVGTFLSTAILVLSVAALNFNQPVAADDSKIIHNSEYYILDAQHGEQWAVQDKELAAKLAELRKKFGQPPNIIHIMWDDTAVGEVGIPFIQKQQGWSTPNINKLASEGNRDYSGSIKIDGTDLREINLRHLRQSFGVVLQDNFLFRGSVKDNIIAGRHGLSFEDAVRAARLAGAEEFIERLPQGYETWIQEGSPNLSGGQRQRLAIARALIVDPKLMNSRRSNLGPRS